MASRQHGRILPLENDGPKTHESAKHEATSGETREDYPAALRVHKTAMPGQHNGRHMTAIRGEKAGREAAICWEDHREEGSTGITAATRRRVTRRSTVKPRMANAAERQASAGAR